MKISLNWLRQYINTDLDAGEIAATLTSIGLEVEGISPYTSHPGGLEGLVIAEVLEVLKHPDADKLSLCKVEVGTGTALPIVCGAPNVGAGQKVVVALVGSTLYPSQGEPFTIKKAKIRGEVSEGMICAEDEIGLGQDHSGIIVLPPEAQTGTPAAEYFGVERDQILEIGLTPNRSDAFSHLGVARDLYAALCARGKKAELCLPGSAAAVKPGSNAVGSQAPEQPSPGAQDSASASTQPSPATTLPAQAGTLPPFPVTVHEPEACLRYSGIALSGLSVGPSPEWLKRRLASIGVRSINNVVDVTNFILHEYGQPLHAFDADRIKEKQIHVRFLPAKTRFVSLDGAERELGEKDLMICDAEKPLCMAGIYGGLNSGVTESSKNIFLESACFEARHIRRSSTAHGLRTDAAARFEKGCDPNMTLDALIRAVALLLECAGGQVASGISDVYPIVQEPREVSLRWTALQRLIGIDIPQKDVSDILTFLGMGMKTQTRDAITVWVPTSKTDVTREADLIEEVLRIYGMDRVPLPQNLRSSIVPPMADAKEQGRFRMGSLLNGAGFSEIFSNPVTRSRYLKNLDDAAQKRVVRLANSLNAELDIMRPDLLFGGMEAVARNLNRRRERLRLFEFGRVFEQHQGGFEEPEQLGLWLCGPQNAESWRNPAAAANFFDLKENVERVLLRCGLEQWDSRSSEHPFLEYGQDYLHADQKIVSFGRVSEGLSALFDLKLPVFYAALNWDILGVRLRQHQTRYRPLSRFPLLRRDLALVLDKGIAYRDVESLARQNGGKLLREVFLFDVYQGSNLGEDKKSYGIGLNFGDDQATLTDGQIEKVMQKLIRACETELNATIRR